MESLVDEKKIKVEPQAQLVDLKPILKQEIQEEVIAGDDDWRNTSFDSCEIYHASEKTETYVKEEQDQHNDKSCIVKLAKSEDACAQETKPIVKEDQHNDKSCIVKLAKSEDACAQETKPIVKEELDDTLCVKHEESFDHHDSNDVKPYTMASEDNKIFFMTNGFPNIKCPQDTVNLYKIFNVQVKLVRLKEENLQSKLTDQNTEVQNEYPVKIKDQTVKKEIITGFKHDFVDLIPSKLLKTEDVKPDLKTCEVRKSHSRSQTTQNASDEDQRPSKSRGAKPKKKKAKCVYSKRKKKRTKTPTTSEVQQNNETAEARKPNLTESDEGSVQEENMKPGSSKRTRAQTKGKEGEVQKTTTTNENTMESEESNEVAKVRDVESNKVPSEVEENNITSDNERWEGGDHNFEDEEPPGKKKKTKAKNITQKKGERTLQSDDELWEGGDNSSSEYEEPSSKKKKTKAKNITQNQKEKTHQCGQCELRFTYSFKLREHKLNVHNAPYSYHCKKCAKGFRKSHQLMLHEDTDCYSLKPFVCKECNKGFTFKHDLKAHTVANCMNIALSPFLCDACGKKFLKHAQLQFHIKSKCGTEKLFKCKTCNKEFKMNCTLKRHVESQCGTVKKFVCEKCGKGFLGKAPLIVHAASNCVIYAN